MGSGDGANGYISGCQVGSDQTGTFEAKWQTLPLPIAFHTGDFTSSELSQMVAAADTWNSFFAASMNGSYIDYGSDPNNPRLSTLSKPSSTTFPNETGIVSANGFSAPVVIYKDLSWPWSGDTAAIALTSFNRDMTVQPIGLFTNAYTEVNYQYFFGSGLPQPDLQSVILHEYGHLAGLGHSCENSAKTDVPLCTDSNINPLYVSAVMYPTFYFDPTTLLGQVKRTLQANDQGRANCLYQTTAE